MISNYNSYSVLHLLEMRFLNLVSKQSLLLLVIFRVTGVFKSLTLSILRLRIDYCSILGSDFYSTRID